MIELNVNGKQYRVEAPGGRSLAAVLRDELGLTGTKIACGEGHCGACTVQLDGVPVLSCITLVHTVGKREVTTIEGLRDHPLVDAFVRADALQCGFCTPGQIVSAAALVEAEPNLTPERVRHAMAGNLCRCGAYPRIEEAVLTWRDCSGPTRRARAATASSGSWSRRTRSSSGRKGRWRPSAAPRCARTATPARAARRPTPPTSASRARCTPRSCAARTPTRR